MANLPEESIWEAGIFQLEQTTPVLGGAPNVSTGAGASNIQALQLGRRTRWLRDAVDGLLGRSITGAGLATGGGTLSANRTITVPIASVVEAEGGAVNGSAMTPLRTKQAIDKFVPLSQRAAALVSVDLNDALENGWYRASGGVTNGPGTTRPLMIKVAAYSTAYVEQVAYEVTIEAAGDTLSWRRTLQNGTWTAWYRLRISEAEIAAMSPASLAATGWQRLPSGLVLQWGAASGLTGDTITFPIAFPSTCYQVLTTDSNNSLTADFAHIVGVGNRSSTGFQISVFRHDGSAGSTTFSFLAVGV